MERRLYEPTEKQIENWSKLNVPENPTDDEFKAMWKKAHHGKVAGWVMGKRDWMVKNLKSTPEYQMGLWQARVDFVQGIGYQGEEITDENANAYRLGYYRGWNDGYPLKGLDAGSIERLNNEYKN